MTTSLTKPDNSGIATNAIEACGIGKHYPLLKKAVPAHKGMDDLWALKGVSFNVRRGEVLGIIGRNGAGKTTLLNIIAGTLSPNEGACRVGGRILGLFNLGVGFQDELSGRENIFLNGAILGATRQELEGELSAIIAFSELGYFIDMPLGSYSAGMRLRLAFSIIANLEFDILVIDEVLGVGDALFQSKCFERIMDFRRAGKTLVITTQGMDLIERLCDQAVLLDHGRLVCAGSPGEVVTRYRQLLNTDKFFVGPDIAQGAIVTSTKKWADDISGWGRRLGTREVCIGSVEIINAGDQVSAYVRNGEAFKVKINFNARDEVKNVHFGVAIFRKDGVYCYGPNTAFDGCNVPLLKRGQGCCTFECAELLLAPGEYRLSIAIWDKDEALAYDYFEGYYPLFVIGDAATEELTRLPYCFTMKQTQFRFPSLFRLVQRVQSRVKSAKNRSSQDCLDGPTLNSFTMRDATGSAGDTFMTNTQARLTCSFTSPAGFIDQANLEVFLGIYREDDICCQTIRERFCGSGEYIFSFAHLAFLPGKYKVSVGTWDPDARRFICLQNKEYVFNMIFNQRDHGTVYLPHNWKFSGEAVDYERG